MARATPAPCRYRSSVGVVALVMRSTRGSPCASTWALPERHARRQRSTGVPIELALALQRASLGAVYDFVRDGRQRHGVGLVGHVGQLQLEVDGAQRLGAGKVPWVALGGRARSRVFIWKPVVLAATAEVLTPLLDDEFTETGGTLLTKLPSVGGVLSLEIGAAW